MDVFCHGGQPESQLNRRQCETENGKETAAGSLDGRHARKAQVAQRAKLTGAALFGGVRLQRGFRQNALIVLNYSLRAIPLA